MQGAYGARLEAGEAAVEVEAAVPQQDAGGARLGDALVTQVDVPPAGEAIFEIPLRLAVPKEDQGRHQAARDALFRSALSSGRMECSASRHAAARYFERCGDHP